MVHGPSACLARPGVGPEIDRALAEPNDPLWLSTAGYPLEQVLRQMEREVASLKETVGDESDFGPFLSALESEQHAQD